ncbi:MAG: polyphosphate kinase 2 [Deltaproteobacteria bacterium]|nr:polyphosphate kinase 2 [Deltaproteobacteria bacterium]
MGKSKEQQRAGNGDQPGPDEQSGAEERGSGAEPGGPASQEAGGEPAAVGTPLPERKKDKKSKKKKKGKKHKKEAAGAEAATEKPRKLKRRFYDKELARLQTELVKLQYWIKDQGLKVVVLFEGRDAAGKGGVIKRISEPMNPRGCRVVALGTPTERERTQWYFQRYVEHLPSAGEIVLFDRSWYNRAGVEKVMGFCTREDYREFLRSCPEFERLIVRSGIKLLKYWFSVSDEEQERRFQARVDTATKRWKLSPMDLESRRRWEEYSRAKDVMFEFTDIGQCRWCVVNSNDKRRAALNCIRHLLGQIPYQDVTPPPIELPPRQPSTGYQRPPIGEQSFVPDFY